MKLATAIIAALAMIALTAFTPKHSLTVSSDAFTNNGSIPMKYSCEGENISPSLHIANIPANAKSLAIICHDPDAPMKGGYTHWVVWNISPMADIPEHY